MPLRNLKILLLIIPGLCLGRLHAQNLKRVEGLLNILSKGCSDSMMVRLNLEIADEFIFNSPDTARYYAIQALNRAGTIRDTVKMAKASNYIGICYYSQGHYLAALEYYQKSETLSRAAGDLSGALKAMNNMGIVYTNMGEHHKAIRTYQEAFDENMVLGNRENAGYNLFNMAAGYLALKDVKKARQIASTLRKFKSDFPAVRLDPNSLIGEIYLEEQKPDSALYHLRQAFDYSRSEGDQYFMTNLHLSMAKAYIMKNSHLEAELEMYFAERTIRENKLESLKLQYLEVMANLLSEQGLHQKAFGVQKEYIALKDSLDRINSINRISELNARYESERQTNQITRQEKLLQQRTSQIRLVVMGGGALCFFAGLIFVNLMRNRRMNELLRTQNTEIQIQRSKIIASIDYAKRIQTAILPSGDTLRQSFNDFFVYLKPRDIVSGDIYWCQRVNDKIYLAVVDCTGHGVPGAFMSLIAYSKLNKVFSAGLRKPAEILWEMHQQVVRILSEGAGSESIQDGMDMSLCCIDIREKTIEFCGANCPVVIISGGELKEYRLNPFSIGGTVYSLAQQQSGNPIESVIIPYEDGDMLFMYTDGMPDQIGGPEKRKYNKPRFRNLLSEIANYPELNKAHDFCDEQLKAWMNEASQTDDILILGVRL